MARLNVLESVTVPAPSVTIEEFAFSEGTGADVMQTGAACLLVDWTAVYSEYFDMLVRRIVSKDRSREYAEDAVQETFVKTIDSNARGTAFEGAAIEKGVNLGGYLWTVASRLNIDGIRADAKISNRPIAGSGSESEDGPSAVDVAFSDNPEDVTVDEIMTTEGTTLTSAQYGDMAGSTVLGAIRAHGSYETVETIRRAIEANGKGQTREGNVRYVKILALRAAGLDQHEISNVLDIPVGNLPKMYQRAAKMAQTIMAQIVSEIPEAIAS